MYDLGIASNLIRAIPLFLVSDTYGLAVGIFIYLILEISTNNLSPKKIGENAELYIIWWGANWAGINNL